ncbi:helicase POLQ-like [Agrilus planipennis]|uniref:Helicase POLQ-like n=1 Tax=Agrilus planipennis TaxID=224129 RepID=A0A1W4X6Y4_AGRPL|nr:helicase POLQ-like [Agrilus planipennis]
MSDEEDFICKCTAMPKLTSFIVKNNSENKSEFGKGKYTKINVSSKMPKINATGSTESMTNKHHIPPNIEQTKNISNDNGNTTNCCSNKSEQSYTDGNTKWTNHSLNKVDSLADKSSTNLKEIDKDLFEQSQNDSFIDLCNSTQFLEQIDKCVLNSGLMTQNVISKPAVTSISQINPPAVDKDANRNKRKSFEKEENVSKVLKRNNETIRSSNKTNDDIWNETVDFRVTQLFKNSQYQTQIASLFEEVETSIFQLGPNQDKFLLPDQTIRNDKRILNSVTNFNNSEIDWKNDSLMVNAINKMDEGNGNFDNSLKNALLKNIDKSFISQHLVNKTLLTEVVFKEYGPFFGLPMKVNELIQHFKGIEKLYDWQEECLNLPAIKNRSNLVYALPTSGGKTLVAEILMLREIICRRKNVIFVLPYVAIVQEKVWALSPFAVALDFLIEEYAAGKGTYPPKKRRYKNSVYIATIEKALGLINSLMEKGRLDEVGLVVVDELHLVGEPGRGPTLETFLTKIIYMNEMKYTDGIQIVGMSATIGNLSDICTFLKADVYKKDFRPVELIEYVKIGNEIARIHWDKPNNEMFQIVRKEDFSYSEVLKKIDPDRLGGLVMEVVPRDSCLIFCSSKKSCQNVAHLLCKVVFPTLREHKKKEKEDLITALKNEGNNNICEILNVSIKFGIAYHHSGLLSEERRLLEDAFREGVICVICCTSTLAAGVNLPAKRVILRQPYVGREFINLSRYKQMVGRAGRAGFGEVGESILICTKEDVPKVRELLQSPMDKALSSLHASEGKGLRHLFLSCVGLGTATNRSQLQQVASKSLLAVQQDKLNVNMKNLTDNAICSLFKLGALQTNAQKQSSSTSTSSSHISLRMETSTIVNESKNKNTLETHSQKKPTITLTNNTKLIISELGKAAIKGCLELSKAHLLYADLTQAQESLVLLDHLHLLYLVTPYDQCEQIKPSNSLYYNLLMRLGKSEKKTAKVLGITESCTTKLFTNQQIKTVSENVLTRFYVSLMLYDLWNGMPVFDVSEKYQIDRGLIQSLMISSATFASNVVGFCDEIEEFWPFRHLLKSLSERLSHCSMKELLPLMELPSVKQSRAKQLYNAGYKTLQIIAKCDPNELVKNVQFMSKKVANQLIAAAKMLLLEKVETLRDEAENVLNGEEQTLDLSLFH